MATKPTTRTGEVVDETRSPTMGPQSGLLSPHASMPVSPTMEEIVAAAEAAEPPDPPPPESTMGTTGRDTLHHNDKAKDKH